MPLFSFIVFEKDEIKEQFGMLTNMTYLHSKTLNKKQVSELIADERGDLGPRTKEHSI